MREIKLHSLENPTKVDLVKLIFHYRGTPFDDQTYPDKPASNMELPFLEMDARKLSKRTAIARYVCDRFEYSAIDPFEVYLVESVCDLKADLELLLEHFSKDQLTPQILAKLKMIENRLAQNKQGTEWFVGNCLTRADFEIFELLYNHFVSDLETLGQFPKLLGFFNRFIESSPTLDKYLKSLS